MGKSVNEDERNIAEQSVDNEQSLKEEKFVFVDENESFEEVEKDDSVTDSIEIVPVSETDDNKNIDNSKVDNIETDNTIVENNEVISKEENNKETDNKKIDNKDLNVSVPAAKKEISYYNRLGSLVGALVILIIVFSFVVLKAFDYNSQHTINYKEGSNVDYKVYLKQNDFYDKPYLEKNMMYVANLIKNIEVDFNYVFNIDEDTSMDFDYEVLGRLIIADDSLENVMGERSYSLLAPKTVSIRNGKNQAINEKITIDYAYYNSIANKFKMDYGIDTSSYLKVYLRIHKKNTDEVSDYVINDDKELSINIPLSERAINIKIDSEKISGKSQVVSNNDISPINIICIILSVILAIVIITLVVKLVRLVSLLGGRESKYDKYIKKLLVEYDRLIVETTHLPDFNKYNIIKVNKFTELLDVRDNLKLPIMYFIVAKHHKSHFYIKHENDIYLYTAKESDIEEQK